MSEQNKRIRAAIERFIDAPKPTRRMRNRDMIRSAKATEVCVIATDRFPASSRSAKSASSVALATIAQPARPGGVKTTRSRE